MSTLESQVKELQERVRSIEDLVQRVTQAFIAAPVKTSTETAPPTPTPPHQEPTVKPPIHQGQIELAFNEDTASRLTFEVKGDYHIIKPKAFLGSDKFHEINKTIRSLGGEYISAGKESHWRIKRV
jgi:hypothetical protein